MEPAKRIFAGLLLVLPIVYFYVIIDANTINVPFIDDYDLLQSIYQLKVAHGFVEAAQALLRQVNQHRFGYERIVMWLIYLVTGSENIKAQIVIGNAYLIGILYFFFKTIRSNAISWYYFIPVPMILFSMVYYENATWGIAAIQNTSLIFFALLSVYNLGRNTNAGWYWAILAAILATFTSGNGLLVWMIGALILLLQKRYLAMGKWILCAAAVISLYFLFDYTFIKGEGGGLLQHPVFNFLFLLAFWGNVLLMDILHPTVPRFYPDIVLCLVLGFGIGLVFLGWIARIFTRRDLDWTDWFLMGVMMFLMGTGAMLVFSRPVAYYVMQGGDLLSRRYMIFGAVLVITAYVCLLILIKKQRALSKILVGVAMAAAVSLNFVSYYMSLSKMREQYEELALDRFYWKHHAMLLSSGEKYGDKLFWNHPTAMIQLISNLETTGLYRFPEGRFPEDRFPEAKMPVAIDSLNKIEEEDPASYQGSLEIKLGDRNNWQNVATKSVSLRTTYNGPDGGQPSYFLLKSPANMFFLPTLPIPNEVGTFFREKTYYSNQFEYSFFSSKLPTGAYQVWIVTKNASLPGKWQEEFTGKTLQN